MYEFSGKCSSFSLGVAIRHAVRKLDTSEFFFAFLLSSMPSEPESLDESEACRRGRLKCSLSLVGRKQEKRIGRKGKCLIIASLWLTKSISVHEFWVPVDGSPCFPHFLWPRIKCSILFWLYFRKIKMYHGSQAINFIISNHC